MGTLAEQMKQEQKQVARPTRLNLLYAQTYNSLPAQLQTFLPKIQVEDPSKERAKFGDGFANLRSNLALASNANL